MEWCQWCHTTTLVLHIHPPKQPRNVSTQTHPQKTAVAVGRATGMPLRASVSTDSCMSPMSEIKMPGLWVWPIQVCNAGLFSQLKTWSMQVAAAFETSLALAVHHSCPTLKITLARTLSYSWPQGTWNDGPRKTKRSGYQTRLKALWLGCSL